MTAKSFPCALWAVPFLLCGEVGRATGNASLVIIIQIVQDAVKCLGPTDAKFSVVGNCPIYEFESGLEHQRIRIRMCP